MKVLYMGIWQNEKKPAVELAAKSDLSSFNRFTRGNVEEMITFGARTVAERAPVGQRLKVEEQSNTIHALARSEGFVALLITDHEYPEEVGQRLVFKIADEFSAKYPRSAFLNVTQAKSLSFPELDEYIKKYQDPQAVDSLMKIQKELDETKVVLHKTIESVLERGEKIDSLVAKSDGLSAQSKMFYTQAKKQNSCCVVM